MKEWQQCLDDLLEIEDGMSDWEVGFVDDMDHHRCDESWWEPTERQEEKIFEIYDRYC